MKRHRMDETDSESDDNNDSKTGNDKPTPVYMIVPSDDANSLVSRFRLLRGPASNVKYSPDSSQDSNAAYRSNSINPSTSSSSRSSTERHISDDLRFHQASCPYARWCQIQKTLLTDAEIQFELTANYATEMMEKGRFLSVRKAMLQAKNRSHEDVAAGPIRYYLDAQRNMFTESKMQAISRCVCPDAQIHVQEEVISSTDSGSQGSSSGSQTTEEPLSDFSSASSSSSNQSPPVNLVWNLEDYSSLSDDDE